MLLVYTQGMIRFSTFPNGIRHDGLRKLKVRQSRGKRKTFKQEEKHLQEEEKAGCFAIIVLQMYCYYRCSVALSHGAVGWSAVCDCASS